MGTEVEKVHTPKSNIELQAERFRDCFEPNAYRLDEQFGWMSESEREALGWKVNEALKQAYIDHLSEMHSSD